ncbi:hypothetical protein Tco_0609175, partial [Tanacetum coccineum]
MNPQEKQQVAARDDKWVPFSERQFLYSIKKVQGTDSYEFLLANKKCTVNAEVFRIILDICLRVEGVDFTDVLDDDTALTFLIDLGYKGPLYKHTNMFVDHMHHPMENSAAITYNCLSGKTASEDYQEYRLSIPETLLTEAIKQSESYQMFIKYSTGQICPKKSKGKVTLSADDNIISDDLDADLELANSISKTKPEEAEEARQVHATHARIVTKFVPKSANIGGNLPSN